MEYDLCQSDLKDFSLLPEYEIHIFKGTLFVFAGVQFHLLVAGMLTRPLVDGYGACTKAPALHNHRNHDEPNQQNDVAKTRKKSVAFSVLVDFEDLATDFGREPSKIEKRSAVANAASKTTHEVKNMNENIENECGLKSKTKNKWTTNVIEVSQVISGNRISKFILPTVRASVHPSVGLSLP